jgi:hypothetical protein
MSERVSPARYRLQIPVKVWFEPEEQRSGKLKIPQSAKNLFVRGETHDLSRSGIAFVVPSIRLRENYLVGDNRPLVAELDLPNGRAQMKIVGRRYELVGEHLSVARYLIGASIEDITAENLEIYEYFLKHGNRAAAAAATKSSLQFGIDKS